MNDFSKIPFCPLKPTEKQELFLRKDTKEVFFGGAAGGGKSIALLMAALKYVEQPGYAALIIRKDLPRLELAGGLIPRSHEWFSAHAEKGVRWVGARRTWVFPVQSGGLPATITFGYLARPLDKFRYASSEFQYIALDELTDFEEDDYLFLFSRLRRTKCSQAKLRIRSASNPGGSGRLWVKQRFIDGAVGEHGRQVVFNKDGRLYIPSRIVDNPHLDADEYRQTLQHLTPVDRERLMNGNWSIQEEAVFHEKWLRYYTENDGQLELLEPGGRIIATIQDGSCRRFVTIDPAGTSAERNRESNGRTPSWSVIQVWDQPTRELPQFLLLRHQVRERFGFDQLRQAIVDIHDEWRPWQIWIEAEKLGQATVDQLKNRLPIQCISPGTQDKKTRATRLVVMMSRGEVLFPKHNTTWRPQLEAEFLAWTGHEREPADQIDAAAYAAIVAGDAVGDAIKLLGPLVLRQH